MKWSHGDNLLQREADGYEDISNDRDEYAPGGAAAGGGACEHACAAVTGSSLAKNLASSRTAARRVERALEFGSIPAGRPVQQVKSLLRRRSHACRQRLAHHLSRRRASHTVARDSPRPPSTHTHKIDRVNRRAGGRLELSLELL